MQLQEKQLELEEQQLEEVQEVSQSEEEQLQLEEGQEEPISDEDDGGLIFSRQYVIGYALMICRHHLSEFYVH